MEGAYNKVLSAKSNVPDQSYLYFMDKLISTVRYALLNVTVMWSEFIQTSFVFMLMPLQVVIPDTFEHYS